MNLLANENFPLASVRLLQEAGQDVMFIGEEAPSIEDADVMKLAIEQGRTILTFDRDYGELIYRYGYRPPAGVIYFRWEEFEPTEPATYLIDLFSQPGFRFEGLFTAIGETSIRQRTY